MPDGVLGRKKSDTPHLSQAQEYRGHPSRPSASLMCACAARCRHGGLIIRCVPRYFVGFPRACGASRGVCGHLQGFRVLPRACRCASGGPGGGSRVAAHSILTPQIFPPNIPKVPPLLATLLPSLILCIASRYLIPNSAISWRVLAHPEQARVSASILQAPTQGETGRSSPLC